MPSSSCLYERGDTIREILNQRSRSEKNLQVWLDELVETPEVYDLGEQEHRLWSALMVQAGQLLNRRLDRLLNEIHACGDAFYDLRSYRRLRHLLGQLTDCRRDVNNFELDVEEVMLVLSTRNEALPAHTSSVRITLNELDDTYERAHDLCLYKLKNITNGWVTASNILISFVMLLVMIAWWLGDFPL